MIDPRPDEEQGKDESEDRSKVYRRHIYQFAQLAGRSFGTLSNFGLPMVATEHLHCN